MTDVGDTHLNGASLADIARNAIAVQMPIPKSVRHLCHSHAPSPKTVPLMIYPPNAGGRARQRRIL